MKQEQMVEISSLATLLEVTPQWIRDLSKKGVLPEVKNGQIAFLSSVRGYIRWLKEENSRNTQSASMTALHDERRRMIALKNEQVSGELLAMPDVEETFFDILGVLRGELAGVPAGATRDLGIRTRIETLIDGAISRAKATFADRIEKLTGGKPAAT